MTTNRTLDVPGATVAYDVHGPLPPEDGRPPLMMIGQPMDASGFGALSVALPRPHGRHLRPARPRPQHPQRRPHRQRPREQAEDVHAVIAALDAGPVELFASSGGAVTALALVAAHPDDVTTLVAHEPPLIDVLPDADQARAAQRGFQAVYHEKGWGAGMAAFIAMSSWQGEFTDEYPPSRRPIRPSSACRPTTTDPVATRSCPTSRTPSPTTAPTSTR